MYSINIKSRLLNYLNRVFFAPIARFLFVRIGFSGRYRVLNTNPAAIGHLCVDVDCFIIEREKSELQFRGILLAPHSRTANSILAEIWASHPSLYVIQNSFICYILDYLRTYPDTSYDCSKYCALNGCAADVYRIYSKSLEFFPSLSWPQLLYLESKKLFESLYPAIDPKKVVVLHSRDSTYDNLTGNSNYYTQNYRNSSISSYTTILRYLKQRGYYVIRIGEYERSKTNLEDIYLELPNLDRRNTELINVYLTSICVLFLGSASGASQLAAIWRRPVFLINVLPYSQLRPHVMKGMAIPKLLSINDRILNIKEIFANGYYCYTDDNLYHSSGIKPLLNSPDDCIADFVDFFIAFVEKNREMEEVLHKSPFQKKYMEICTDDSYDYLATSLVPRHFFFRNKILLV